MKKLRILLAALAILLPAALLIPVPRAASVDGAREYRAPVYRIVKWDRQTPEGRYQKTRVYFFGDLAAPLETLWAREGVTAEAVFFARVAEIDGDSVTVEPLEEMNERRSADRIVFSAAALPPPAPAEGQLLRLTYTGEIRESYPAQIDATAWRVVDNLTEETLDQPWLDSAAAEAADPGLFEKLTITRVYRNCFFAETRSPTPYLLRVDGAIADRYCPGDAVDVEYRNGRIDPLTFRAEASLSSIGFSADRGPETLTDAKPVLYLYPQNTIEATVRLYTDGRLTCAYPAYGGGWRVTAAPDGTLTDEKGQTYNYLYWEAETQARFDFSRGFCVRGADTAAFLEDALARLGLTRREANEFIVYWLPRMEGNPYNRIAFQTDVYTESAKLEISPAPDTLIRVFMAWAPLDAPVELPPQTLSAPARVGFTAVEWGGAECSRR